MMDHMVEELANLYGIEIYDANPGQGGLFYADSEGNKVVLNDIFESDDCVSLKEESVSLRNCKLYSTYSANASSMPSAA